jgi:hypothetical protein
VAALLAFALFILIKWQIIGSMVILGQRWSSPGIGTIAYNITDANGCRSFNGLEFLEQGARSRPFRIIQTIQFVWSYIVMFLGILAGCAGNGEEGKHRATILVFAGTTVLINIPLLIYEGLIAGKGMPVKISGNCMLVELDPRLGFLDTQIDSWWKALSSIGGL